MTTNQLFPTREERQRTEDVLTRQLGAAQARVTHGPVVPPFDYEGFSSDLAAFEFTQPRSLDQTLRWVIEQLEVGIVQVTHPRYFGLFNPTATYPAQCADRIAAVFNPQLATATTSRVPVAIETHVIRSIAARLRLPAADGHFTTGGSEANFTAVMLALTRACPRFAADGVRAFAGTPVLYVSADSHSAWLKIAHQAGIGRSAVRLVETDGAGCLDLGALGNAILIDRRRGCVPVLIAATAGTTNAGMIDPLPGCAEIARWAGVWYHVDAAWGGGLIASERLRARLAGIEQADSVTIDAHKWFATTMGCGMFLTRHPALLAAACHVSASYMPSNAATVDPYVTSVQWSRRFLGLRLFLSLATVGWTGYAEHVEHALSMIELLREQVMALGWSVVNQSPVGVLCFIPRPPQTVRPIVRRVVASGKAWVSVAVFEGQEVIRACVTSGVTTADDVAALVTVLEYAARDIN